MCAFAAKFVVAVAVASEPKRHLHTRAQNGANPLAGGWPMLGRQCGANRAY